MKNLTLKQQRFADLYEGNGTEACRQAGYKGSDNVLAQQARTNLRNPQIVKVIKQRHIKASAGRIAHREERQRFWTAVMMDPDKTIQVRLKASEILGRSCGDFIAKIEHTQKLSFEALMNEITTNNDPLVNNELK